MNCPVPPRKKPLRPYQARGLEQGRCMYGVGHRCVLLVAPTGAGKTRLGVETVLGHLERASSSTVLQKRPRVLWLAHRVELVKQAAQDLLHEGITDLRVEMANGAFGPTDASVVVASIQTLLARNYALTQFTFVVLDEAHHYVSAEWGQIKSQLSGAYVLGLTATPQRSDRTGLGDLFNAMIIVATYRELIDMRRLRPIVVFAPARVVQELAWDPVEAWQRHSEGKPGVVFAKDVAHARELAERFNTAGYRAACIDGKASERTRERDLERFQRGELDVLTNVHVLTEGWDAPRAQVCMLARGCSADGTYLQMVGRVMRPSDGAAGAQEGEYATLIDLRGVVHQHGLPDEHRVYSLEGRKPISREKRDSLRVCPDCACCFLSAPACPRCGFDDFPKPKPPKVKKRGLREITEKDIADRSVKFEFFMKLVGEMRRGGFKPAYVGVRFKQRFGHWPMWIIPKEKAA